MSFRVHSVVDGYEVGRTHARRRIEYPSSYVIPTFGDLAKVFGGVIHLEAIVKTSETEEFEDL